MQGHRIEYVDGRVCLRCRISAGEKRIDAHLIVDLGISGPLILDRDACSLLEVQPRDLITLDLPGTGRLESLAYRGAELSALRNWTTENSQALKEVPVRGIVGLKAFQESSVWLDIQARELEFGPSAIPTESWHRLDTTQTPAGRILVEIEPCPDYRLQARFTTRQFETRIDADCAAVAEALGGNSEHCRLGPFDLRQFTAIRPQEGLQGQSAEVGNSFWQNFQMLIEPDSQVIRLLEKPDRLSDLHEQQYYQALAEGDIDAVERYFLEFPESRLAAEAALKIIESYLGQAEYDRERLDRACSHLARAFPADKAVMHLVAYVDQLFSESRTTSKMASRLLEHAKACALKTTDASALIHEIEARQGWLALCRGDLKQARLQLMSALFGQANHPQTNYWMGCYYEKRELWLRAWSRYLKSCLHQTPHPEAVAALERLTNDTRLRRHFSLRDARDFLEGYIPAYHPVEVPLLAADAEVILLEAFVCADDPTQAGLCLALESLQSSTPDRRIEIMMHHLGNPRPDPIECQGSNKLAQAREVSRTPALFFNGQALDLGPETLENPASVLAALAHAEVETVPSRLTLDVRQGPGRTYELHLAFNDSVLQAADRCEIYLVEQACLLVSANQIWLQPHVVRARIDSSPVDIEHRECRWALDLDEVEARHLAYVKGLEAQQQIEFRSVPSYIDASMSRVVLKCTSASGQLVAVGSRALDETGGGGSAP